MGSSEARRKRRVAAKNGEPPAQERAATVKVGRSSGERCRDCRFYDASGELGMMPPGVGYCRGAPPVPVFVNGQVQTYFATVGEKAWCAKFEKAMVSYTIGAGGI